MLNGTEYSCLL